MDKGQQQGIFFVTLLYHTGTFDQFNFLSKCPYSSPARFHRAPVEDPSSQLSCCDSQPHVAPRASSRSQSQPNPGKKQELKDRRIEGSKNWIKELKGDGMWRFQRRVYPITVLQGTLSDYRPFARRAGNMTRSSYEVWRCSVQYRKYSIYSLLYSGVEYCTSAGSLSQKLF